MWPLPGSPNHVHLGFGAQLSLHLQRCVWAGNEDLKSKTGARVVAPKADSHRIPGIDEGLSGGDVWKFGDLEMTCIETPGHTSHSLCFWFQSENALFTGADRFGASRTSHIRGQ